MDLNALLAQLAELESVTDPAILEALRADLAAAATERAESDTAEAVAELEKIADALDAVSARESALAAEAADRKARAKAALDRVKNITDPTDPEDPAEPVVPAEPEAVLEPVAAAASTAPVVSRVAARRPGTAAPKPAAETTGPESWGLVASANVDGMQMGSKLENMEALGQAFRAVFEATRGWDKGRTELRVATRSVAYPDERTLGRDSALNTRRIEAVTSLPALAASGGICAPTQINYDLPIVGSDARPFRDQALARFGADRGGVTLFPPPVLSDLTAAITTWTEANDRTPADPTTKPCLTVTCPEPDETLVDAIVSCLKFGNYRARYFPEQIAAWTKLASVAHARHAETKLITAVGAGSTQVTTGQLLGSARDVLASVERLAVAFRNRHRLPRSAPMRWAAPEWLLANMRTDIMRQLPGGSTDENMAVAEATILSWFSVRAINPTFFMDGESGQVFGTQPDGHALPWPSTVITYLYEEGAWLFLDGGQLDLGLVRDSTLNSTNDVQLFMETFEQVAFHGTESYRLTMDICPNGWTSGTVDINPCTTGS